MAIRIHFPLGECFSQNIPSLSELSSLMQQTYEIASKEKLESKIPYASGNLKAKPYSYRLHGTVMVSLFTPAYISLLGIS